MNEVRERRTEYVITKRGKPVAKLAPCDDTPADAFGILAGSVLGHDYIVSPDSESSAEQLRRQRPVSRVVGPRPGRYDGEPLLLDTHIWLSYLDVTER